VIDLSRTWGYRAEGRDYINRRPFKRPKVSTSKIADVVDLMDEDIEFDASIDFGSIPIDAKPAARPSEVRREVALPAT
jgi:hypothetical protein